jgi:pimeloyl-ACP methyl ester carboxylesterase
LADGRRVAWAEWGAREGPAVVFLHRNPGSRLFDPEPTVTRTSGIRLITIDRPGYGRTAPLREPSRSAVAADLAAVVEELALERVALVGWSGGGMFAVDAAALLGDRVRSFSLVCTPAPDSEIAWIPDDFRPLIESARADPARALPSIVEACGFYADDPAAAASSDPGEADAAVRARPGIAEQLAVMMREGARQGATGMAADIVAGARDDPFPIDRVDAPVHLWYGAEDWIGPEHGRWYEQQFHGAKLTIVPDVGHLLPLVHWAAVLESAVT